MRTEELLVLLLVFCVTLGDHSAVPNIYVVSMILAVGKGFNPYLIFAAGFSSVIFYENALYSFGRYLRRRRAPKNRPVKYLLDSARAVSGYLAQKRTLWLVFGRFVAFVGLYVPFGAGQMGYRRLPFLFWTTLGALVHMLAFGIPAYILGDLFHDVVERIPLGWISVCVLFVIAGAQGVTRYRRGRRRRLAESGGAERGLAGQHPADELQNEDAD